MKKNITKTKLRIGDEVIIITGNSLGSTGKIREIDKANGKVLIEGANFVKKHKKPTQENQKGDVVDIPSYINISNVMYYNSKTNKGERIGYKFEDGKKKRYLKQSNTLIDK